jgi:hypothetical protein
MYINFITFGSHDNYIEAGTRLINQVDDLKIFNNIKLYSKDDLENDINFWSLHKDFILSNSRGFGYWIWKPYLIKKNMDEMKDNDILLYLDCGCEIDISEKEYFLDYLEKVKSDYIIGSFGKTLVENSCKMDLLYELDINNNDNDILKSKMHQAGTILMLVTTNTRNLINKWYELCCNYHLIDDSPSIINNLDTFQEHRHDQSIYSLLTKKYNLYSKIDLSMKCIKILRNRSGNSLL